MSDDAQEKQSFSDKDEIEDIDEQVPWWKRQEREARKRNQKLNDEWKEEKQQKQRLKEEQERLKEEQDKRPWSIKNFEFVYLISLLTELHMYYLFPEVRPEVQLSIPLQLGILVFVYGSFALLCLLASRKRSNIAKWIVVILSGFTILSLLLQMPEIIPELISLSGLSYLQIGQLIFVCATIRFAFAKESRAWFAGIQISEDKANGSFSKPDSHEERTW